MSSQTNISNPLQVVSPRKRKAVEKDRERIITQMQRRYPGVRLQEIHEIAYRSSRCTPEDIIEQGGFRPIKQEVSLATKADSPNNEGLVDFSFVPEVTTIFRFRPGKYIYATPIDKGYLMKGQWRQVAVPSLPMPEFMVARKVLATDGLTATLDKPIVIGNMPDTALKDDDFRNFLAASTLQIPQEEGLGDENYPAVYTIRDTNVSKRLGPPTDSYSLLR